MVIMYNSSLSRPIAYGMIGLSVNHKLTVPGRKMVFLKLSINVAKSLLRIRVYLFVSLYLVFTSLLISNLMFCLGQSLLRTRPHNFSLLFKNVKLSMVQIIERWFLPPSLFTFALYCRYY